MNVILRKDIENLGAMGEVVKVKDGYARNYLIPLQMAYFAAPGALKKLEQEKKHYLKRQEAEKSRAEALADKLGELQVSVAMKVGEEGKLFGSVTHAMIADELKLLGYSIDKRDINIIEPIKSLGIFNVKVKLHSQVQANLKIWVIADE